MYLIVGNGFAVQSQSMTKEEAWNLINSDYMVFKVNEFGKFEELADVKETGMMWEQVEFEFEFDDYK